MQKYDIFLIYKYFLLFHCASWQFFIVAVGSFLLCQLVTFHCASWQFFNTPFTQNIVTKIMF